MAQTRNNNRLCTRASRRKLGKQACGPWATLPEDLLFLIIMHLEFMDFLAFGRVCRLWRLAAAAQRKIFCAPKPPFIGIISSFAKRSISFVNIFDRSRYKTMLSDVARKPCLGSSCGYLIMLERDYKLWLVNPITGRDLSFPCLPGSSRREIRSKCRAILVYSPKLSDYQVVAIYRDSKRFVTGGPYNDDWLSFPFGFVPCEFADLAFFRGTIYVLATNSLISQVAVGPSGLMIIEMDVKGVPSVSGSNLQLVTSNERLFMVDCYSKRELSVYELDFERMAWVRTMDLGEEALFVTDVKSSFVANPTKWGARGNCVYILQKKDKLCYVFSLDGRVIESIQIPYVGRPTAKLPFIWYFPECSYSRDNIK